MPGTHLTATACFCNSPSSGLSEEEGDELFSNTRQRPRCELLLSSTSSEGLQMLYWLQDERTPVKHFASLPGDVDLAVKLQPG